MAKPHTPEGPTNPEVRFERTDIDPGAIVRYMLTFAGAVGGAAAFVLVIAGPLIAWGEAAKKTDLPPMAAVRGPEPGPRLEAIEDLEERNPQLLPPRAAEYLAPQRRELEGGGKTMPIAEAMDALARSLPKGKEPPDLNKNVRLPSRAAAGRVETGGK